MNKSAYNYVVLVSIAAGIVVLLHDWSAIPAMSRYDLAGLAALIGLGILSEAMAIYLTVEGVKGAAKSSMAFLPLLTCAVIFPPEAAILAAALIELVTEAALVRIRAAWKAFLNVSQSIIAIGFGAWIYQSLGGTHGTPLQFDFSAFLGLAIAFFTTNMLSVSAFFAVRNGSKFISVVRQVVGPGAINVVYGLLASPISMIAALLYDKLYVGGILLIILPIVLIRYSYLSKIQLQQSNRDLLKVLIKTIETRDPYTSGHSLRVSRLARLIAVDLGFSARRVETIETAALLHDIGKIDSVYAEIIQKRDRLTDEEHRVIKTHAVKGAELLQSLTSFPDDVIRGVRHHHERYDGKGYPDGLMGKEIPITARIIMLCDSIDAMLSHRPYRSAMTVEQVAEEIQRCAGSQFDPDIVEVVLRKGTLAKAAAQIGEESPLDLVGA